MEKEQSYYDRMNKTMNQKYLALYPVLRQMELYPSLHNLESEEHIVLMDYGSGMSMDLVDLISQNHPNVRYIAVDSDRSVVENLKNLGIEVYHPNHVPVSLYRTVDVLFMSSVVHELYSYLDNEELEHYTILLQRYMKSGCRVVIRDWLPETNLIKGKTNKPMSIKVKDAIYARTVLEELTKNGVIKQSQWHFRDNSKQIVLHDAISTYEFLYHATWGIKSLPREGQETYVIKECFENFLTRKLFLLKDFSLIEETGVEDYAKHFKEFLDEPDEYILSLVKLLPPKAVTYYTKKVTE